MPNVDVILKNPVKPETSVAVCAPIDETHWEMRISVELALQLGLQEDDKRYGIPYVCIQVACNGRSFYTGALVMGDQVILGRREIMEMEENIRMKKVA